MMLSRLCQVLSGRQEGADVGFHGVTTDSRNVTPGQLFVALSGPRFDGHDYLAAARAGGAVAALVSRPGDWGLPHCVVADTRLALGQLARQVRRDSPARLAAVTGSNGKTTVKEMLAAILSQVGPTLATQGNLNNDIGVPLTLFRLEPEHRYAVIEMGANHQREIDYLVGIAEPDVGLVNNAGAAHLEGFGGYDGVAQGKGEMFAGLPPHGIAVINADDKYAPLWRQLAGERRVLDFGSEQPAAVRAEAIEAGGFRLVGPGGAVDIALGLPGRHNVMNALAASAVAIALEVPLTAIAAGLAAVAPVPGRLNWRPGVNQALLLDDTYNANPSSLRVGLEVVAERAERRWLALGDMGELGDQAEAIHAEAGRAARASGIERLYAVGPLSQAAVTAFGAGGQHFADQEQLIAALRSELRPGVALLIKGSRSSAMERVVAGVCEHPVE